MMEILESIPAWLPAALLMSVLIILSGLPSACETALFYLSREELRRMQTGGPAERQVAVLMRDPDRMLSVLLFLNLFINLVYFAVSLIAARRLVMTGHASAAATLALIGFFGLIFFGEVAPKNLAVKYRRVIAIWSSGPLTVAQKILGPILPVLKAITLAMRRVFFPNLKQEPYLEVEDIERAVETSELGVEIALLEQEMLGRILEISDMTVEEIMRPRGSYHVWQPPVSLVDLKARGTIPEVMLFAGEDGDNVSKALMLYDLDSLPARNLESVADQVIYVPWSATVADALALLRAGTVSVAVVVNEYGETVGIVTEDDVLDSMFNPASSRGRRMLEREPVVIHTNGLVIADGLATLRYLAERLDIKFENKDDSPVTIVALLYEELERFPVIGDQCVWEQYQLNVIKAGEPGDPLQVSLTKIPVAES
ncbi:CNNM domain-containing protein [Planctomicrobium sp. SH668]|uniref:CNNM domain-containing protein n=1 Tax=Planctomicrobium sp. SH668 TaxID=3448126 RepID=UPI003F5CB8B7